MPEKWIPTDDNTMFIDLADALRANAKNVRTEEHPEDQIEEVE